MENDDVQDALDWGRIVADKTVLGSTDRGAIKGALESYLGGLTQRYLSNRSPRFPSNQELQKLHDLCIALAQLLGTKKNEFGQYYSAIKRIQNRYSKIGVAEFFDALLQKILKLDVPPRTTIHNALHSGTVVEAKRIEVLKEVFEMLGSEDWLLTLDTKPWEAWLQTIVSLKLAAALKLEAFTKCTAKLESKQERHLLAFGAFVELMRRQCLWKLKYEKMTEPARIWIFNLQRSEDLKKMKNIFHGNTPESEQVTDLITKDKNRQRRKQSYRKFRS